MKSTLLIGEPMGLLAARETGPFDEVSSWDFFTAGAEMNVAIGISRLGQPVSYITKLGTDPFGSKIIKALQANGIDTSLITFSDDRKTGFMLKSRADEGDPEIYYYRKGSAASTLNTDDIEKLDLTDADWIHATGITPALTEETRSAIRRLEKKAHEEGLKFSFDPNLRPQLWNSTQEMADFMNEMAAKSDIFMPGIKECEICIGKTDPEEAAQTYLDQGCPCVIIKLGGDGAYYATKTESGYVPGFKVENIVDTVGAGDGFAAGVVSALKEGLPLDQAVLRGNAIGAIQLTSKSDNEGLPTREELDAFMAGDPDWRKTK